AREARPFLGALSDTLVVPLAPLPPAVWLRAPADRLPYPLEEPRCTLSSRARHGLWNAVRALGLGAGDEVLAPAYHHGSEIEALCRADLPQARPAQWGVVRLSLEHALWLATRSPALARLADATHRERPYAPGRDFALGDLAAAPLRATLLALRRVADERAAAV